MAQSLVDWQWENRCSGPTRYSPIGTPLNTTSAITQ
jgi:hypothetical protein